MSYFFLVARSWWRDFETAYKGWVSGLMVGSRGWICLKVWRARLTDVGEVFLALTMRLFENQQLLFQSLKWRKTNREITKGARLSARVCLV